MVSRCNNCKQQDFQTLLPLVMILIPAVVLIIQGGKSSIRKLKMAGAKCKEKRIILRRPLHTYLVSANHLIGTSLLFGTHTKCFPPWVSNIDQKLQMLHLRS